MQISGNYIYKHNVNWSMLTEGITLPIDSQHIFSQNMGKMMQRGEVKDIKLILDGKTYHALIRNVAFDQAKYKRSDILQIRYKKNGELAIALQNIFYQSYNYISSERASRDKSPREKVTLPEGFEEYLAIYTTELENTYLLEAIVTNDLYEVKGQLREQTEKVFEAAINYNLEDDTSAITQSIGIIKVRKLNRAIGNNLKQLYDYRCQICGSRIGDNYGSYVIEAHHIDEFVKSMNNNANNQMIVCPNHHSIIHDVHPSFDKRSKIYIYQNGYREGLALNLHL